MVGTETAGTVATYSSGKQVFVCIVIVDAAVHRYQCIAFGKTAYAFHRLGSGKAIPLEGVGQEAVGTGMVAVVVEVLVRITQHGIYRMLAELLVVLQNGFQQFGVIRQFLYTYISVIAVPQQVALGDIRVAFGLIISCLLYTSPSPRDRG